MVVQVLCGVRFGPRERIFDAVIDKVEVKTLGELSPREIEHDNPEIRRTDEMANFLGQLYNREVDSEDVVTVIRFSQIMDGPVVPPFRGENDLYVDGAADLRAEERRSGGPARRTPRSRRPRAKRRARRRPCSGGAARRRTGGTCPAAPPRSPRTSAGRRRSRDRRRPSRRAPCGAPRAASRRPCPLPGTVASPPMADVGTYPKIELHVHLEGTVRPATLLRDRPAQRLPAPGRHGRGAQELYAFRDFRHFIEVWILTTNALRTEADFRQIVVDYAAEAASHGAVYLEGIFSPAERVRRGVGLGGDLRGRLRRRAGGARAARRRGAADARHPARLHPGGGAGDGRVGGALPRAGRRRRRARRPRGGVPAGAVRGRRSAWRSRSASARCRTPARWPAPPRCAARSRRSAPTGCGTGSAPWRIRASSASSPDAAPCSTSVRSRTCAPASCASLAEHPLPRLAAAGVRCSISTDDPAMFDTDLSRDYEAAASLGARAARLLRGGRRRARSATRRRVAPAADRRGVRLGVRLVTHFSR